jgi:hypothetical protein
MLAVKYSNLTPNLNEEQLLTLIYGGLSSDVGISFITSLAAKKAKVFGYPLNASTTPNIRVRYPTVYEPAGFDLSMLSPESGELTSRIM